MLATKYFHISLQKRKNVLSSPTQKHVELKNISFQKGMEGFPAKLDVILANVDAIQMIQDGRPARGKRKNSLYVINV